MIKSKQGVSFQDARQIYSSQKSLTNPPDINSLTSFPILDPSENATIPDREFSSQTDNAFFLHPAASDPPPPLTATSQLNNAQTYAEQSRQTISKEAQFSTKPKRPNNSLGQLAKNSNQTPGNHSKNSSSARYISPSRECHSGHTNSIPRDCTNTHASQQDMINSQSTSEQVDQIEILKEILLPIIPILLKLLMSNSLTEKIECILEFGSIIKCEEIISKFMRNMGLTSVLNTQK